MNSWFPPFLCHTWEQTAAVWAGLGSVLPGGRGMDGWLLTALPVWEILCYGSPEAVCVRTSTLKLAFGALNQSDLKIPHSLLPPSRTSSHRQLQPRRREAATLPPAGSRRLWPRSPKPLTPSSMAAHYIRPGTHTWPQPLLTCQASLTCIRMLPPLLLLHWAPPAPSLISSPRRAPQGMLQRIPPTLALWCTRSLSVLGPVSSLLPAWPLLSTNTNLPPSLTLGLPEAQPFTLDTHWALPRSASILTCSWWVWGRRGQRS